MRLGSAHPSNPRQLMRAKVRADQPLRTTDIPSSCASRILELKDVDFFKELRDTKTVADTLSTRGHNYEGKHIAAALINLTKRGTIRRVKKDGNWMYQNP